MLDVTLRDKTYVIVNMDETSVNELVQKGHGYVGQGFRRVLRRHQHHPVFRDRTNVKTTLMGVVCDQPHLQPHLPQVFLPKYTQNAEPPAHVRAMYASQGYPFQFWHRSGGSTTPAIFRMWATTLRAAVHSFNSDAWIVLVVDCHSSHLDLEAVQHLKRLGVVTVVIPAKLTWLLQPLDVYVYSDLKRTLRGLLHHDTLDRPENAGHTGSWISPTASAAKRVLARTDWSEEFEKLGLGMRYGGVRSELEGYVGAEPVYPALPTLAEFATLTSRIHTTLNTRLLYRELMLPAIRVRDLPGDTQPPRGAAHDIPEMPPAMKRRREAVPPAGGPTVALRDYLRRQEHGPALGGIVGDPALQVSVRPARTG